LSFVDQEQIGPGNRHVEKPVSALGVSKADEAVGERPHGLRHPVPSDVQPRDPNMLAMIEELDWQ
jgi:hypothetical protein